MSTNMRTKSPNRILAPATSYQAINGYSQTASRTAGLKRKADDAY